MSTTDTPTPRTDKWEWEQECNFDVPWEDHCRTLERELAAAKAELQEVERQRADYLARFAATNEENRLLKEDRTAALAAQQASAERARARSALASTAPKI